MLFVMCLDVELSLETSGALVNCHASDHFPEQFAPNAGGVKVSELVMLRSQALQHCTRSFALATSIPWLPRLSRLSQSLKSGNVED